MWDVSGDGHPQGINGWQTDNTKVPPPGQAVPSVNARCSNFTAPPTVFRNLSDPALREWSPEEWWKGYHLLIPGQGDQNILANTDGTTKGQYPALTKDHWRFECLPTTANGQPGEGFLGEAPDGTRYWFDYLVYRKAEGMSRQLDSSDASLLPKQSLQRFVNKSIENLITLLSGSSVAHALPISDGISRGLGVLLVTRVEDRFGNYLLYHYDTNGYLTGIESPKDGRSLSVTYVSGTSLVQSVTLQPGSGTQRTWIYSYSPDSLGNLHLSDVELPDGSHWTYDMAALQSQVLRGGTGLSSCRTLRVPGDLGPFTATITHPSGLVGQFTVQGVKHGRSFVPRSCQDMYQGDEDSQGSYALHPKAWYSLTTTQVTYSGAGVPTRSWYYKYSPSNDSWADCTGTCPTSVSTDVVAPDGSMERSTFSNRFDVTEGQLQRTDDYSTDQATLLRSQVYHYAPPDAGPFPSRVGDIGVYSFNTEQLERYSPLDQRVTSQDGDTYNWQAEAFDAYLNATRTKRFSSAGPMLEEQIAYLNDDLGQRMGLRTTVTNLATGEVESKNVYLSPIDTLAERWRFGQKLMSYSFDGDGNLQSFTDGRNYTTSLSTYVRGIPTLITYPDQTTEKLEVDDIGQIRSITDQALAKTVYTYDGVGRLTRIDYPTNDGRVWNPETIDTVPVTASEYGIAGMHWRRTVSKGASRRVTYLNAELQPILTHTYISGDPTSDSFVRTDYNFRGQVKFASYPVASATDINTMTSGTYNEYDGIGRPTFTRQDSEYGAKTLVTQTEYLSGARKRVTDPKTHVTTTTYQVFDTPDYDAPVKVEAPAGVTQVITRNVYGDPTSIRQYGTYNGLSGDVTKTLVYDSHHRLCRTIEPESGSEVMDYDGANNLAWSADGLSLPAPTTGTEADCYRTSVADGSKTKRTYDEMNRVHDLLPPAGTQSTEYTYDPRGNVQTAVSGMSTWSSHRNALGLLTDETMQLTGQNAWTLGYGYDANGALSSITYPNASQVNYAPDALGRPTQVGSYARGVKYFPNGEVSAFTYGNDALYSAEQNERQLLRNFSYAQGATPFLSEDFAYDYNANITDVTDMANGPRTKSFSYDPLDRLAGATANSLWGSEGYTYDPLNNIRTRTTAGGTLTYNYDATNRLTGLSNGAVFQYDSRGNLDNKSGVALNFDAKNQLTDFGGQVGYSYDAFGRRVSKAPTGADPTYYFYSQAGQLMYQREPGSNKATNYIYLGKRMIARDAVDTRILTPAEVNVILTRISGPTLSADATTLSTTIDISNQGGATLTASGPYPVTLSDRLLASSGGVLVNGLDHVAIPDIGIGQHATVTITTPASSVVGTGKRLQFMLVQQGGSWFDAFGTTPITVGPYVTPTSPANNSTGAYTVGWTALDGATSYVVQEQAGGNWTALPATTATSIAVSGKGNGTYGYQVQACTSATTCSVWSNTTSTTVLFPPPAPASISVPGTSTGSVTISWTASPTATGYELQQRLGTDAWGPVYTGTATQTSRTVQTTGSYTYQVRATNASGPGAWRQSSAVAVTIPPGSAPTLTAPATNHTGSYTVSWTTVSGATSYTLQERLNAGAWVKFAATTATSRAITGKDDGSYGYQVSACNAGGCKDSMIQTVAVSLPPPPPPNAVMIDTVTPKVESYTGQWDAVPNATRYEVSRNGFVFYSGTATTMGLESGSPGFESGNVYQLRACNAVGCSAWEYFQ